MFGDGRIAKGCCCFQANRLYHQIPVLEGAPFLIREPGRAGVGLHCRQIR